MNKKLTLLLLLSFYRFYAMEPDQSVGRLRRGEIQQTLDGLYDQIEQMQERGKAEVAAKLFLAKKLDKERMAHEETQLENARLQHALEEQELRVEKIINYEWKK